MGKVEEKDKIDIIIKKLDGIENYLKKLVRLIPEESLEEYENAAELKNAYFEALKNYPPG